MAQPEIEEAGINQHLPDELLSNILIRLPSKLVVRCKLVCKRWSSLISDPSFVHSYLSRLPPSPSSWTVVGERVRDGCIEYDQPRHMRSRQDFDALSLSVIGDREGRPRQSLKFSGANDGMILFGLVDRCSENNHYNRFIPCSLYYICNPAIRKLIKLSLLPPESPPAERLPGSGGVAHVEDGVLESFRVVLSLPLPERRVVFWVYASETQQWNEYPAPQTTIPTPIYDRSPTAFNRKLHWFAAAGGISLIAYDPYANPGGGVLVIPLPDDCEPSPHLDWNPLMCDASSDGKELRYFKMAVKGDGTDVIRFKLWALEDDGYRGWGAPRHESDYASVRFEGGGVVTRRRFSTLSPMFFDPFDPDVLYLGHWRDRHYVVSYDVKTRKVEVVQDKDVASGHAKNEMFPWHLALSVDLFGL